MGAAREAGRRLALGTLEYVGSRDAVIPEDDVSAKGLLPGSLRDPRRRGCKALEKLRTPYGCCLEPAPLHRSCLTHQGLKGCVLHEVIIQVTVGHHPVDLDAAGKTECEEEPQAEPVPGVLPGHQPRAS